MRATDLCYRSPKEPNPPFCQNPHDEFKKKFKQFRKSTRWCYGSIYEVGTRQSPRVGPSSYKNNNYSPKPCAALIKPLFCEEISQVPESKFEMVGNLRVLQICNLKRRD